MKEKETEKYNNFEEALKILNKTVEKFNRDDNISLDELVKNYQSGIDAYDFCINELENAKKQIRNIDDVVKK